MAGGLYVNNALCFNLFSHLLCDAEYKMVLVVAAALIDGKGRVLLAQRPEGRSMAGLWEFPGGKVGLCLSTHSAWLVLCKLKRRIHSPPVLDS